MAAKPQLSIQLRLRRPNAGGLYRGWPALTDPQAPESSTRKSSARSHRSTCADTRRSRRHRCAEFRTDRVRYVLSLNSPCQCLRTGLSRLPPRRSIGWPALERGHTWKGSFRAAEGRSTGLPGSLTSDAGLPKSGVIWQNRKIFFQIMEGGFDGSPGSDVDLSDRGRAGQLVRGGAAIENAAHNSQPQRIRARVSPADEALQPIEPAAGADGYRRFLRCGVQAHSHRCDRSGAYSVR